MACLTYADSNQGHQRSEANKDREFHDFLLRLFLEIIDPLRVNFVLSVPPLAECKEGARMAKKASVLTLRSASLGGNLEWKDVEEGV